MKKIILTKGLPASGKDFWAEKIMSESPGQYKRVNKDMLRKMLDVSKWSGKNEQFILKIRNYIVEEALKAGKHAIVSDTNLHSKHKNEMQRIAARNNAIVEVKDFTDITPKVCIERDLKRSNSVGQKVIMGMYNKFIRTTDVMERKLDPLVFDEKIPYCFCSDLDGTLAHITDRSPYDGKLCASDLVNISVKMVLEQMQKDYEIIILSGRNGDSRPETEKWLKDNGIVYNHLYMREVGDSRKDTIVKKEMFDLYLKDKYNIVGIIDDRLRVNRMWVSLGLTVFDVNQNDVDF